MSEAWRPFGVEDDAAEEYEALVDGVPDWMFTSFWSWVFSAFQYAVNPEMPYEMEQDVAFDRVRLMRFERKCRVMVGFINTSTVSSALDSMQRAIQRRNLELVLADFIISEDYPSRAESLETILQEAGSVWKVGARAGKPALVRRVPEAVQDAADRTIASSRHAGKRLAEAWSATFGMRPDPSQAYALAVKAVEDAAIPVVCPTARNATLGKVIIQMRDQRNWSLPMQRDDPEVTSGAALLGMMKMLWAGHADRHGGHEAQRLDITHEEAEAAVMAAVTLVQWFTSGAVTRRS
ncbi:hypothetical protein [Sinomonas susongensis]|uniref:hypothetical protein n=1 Tax=Sinomonas susongensis TaxID=1324851 RepID=UPI001108B67D|nr:hypothetical protein [Sinomonas susongensis]